MQLKNCLPLLQLVAAAQCSLAADSSSQLELSGLSVIPHVQSREMRYRRELDFSLGARVQLFLRNAGTADLSLAPDKVIRLRGKSPEQLLTDDEWTWHDFPSAWSNAPLVLRPGALTVWSFNGKQAPWGVGTSAALVVGNKDLKFDIAEPRAWLSAVTFLGSPTNPYPDSLIFHVANRTAGPLRLEACRLWLPKDNPSWRVLLPQPWFTNFNAFPADAIIPAGDKGGARVHTGTLPLSYAAVEARLVGHQRSALAIGPQGFARIETETRRAAERAHGSALVLGAMRVRRIFDERQVMSLAHRPEAIHVTGMPEKMDRQHRLGARRDGALDQVWIQIAGRVLRVHIDRLGADVRDGPTGGNESERSGNDLVAGLDVEQAQGQVQRRRAAVDRDRVPRAAEFRKVLLELLHIRSQAETALVQSTGDGRVNFGAKRAHLRREV